MVWTHGKNTLPKFIENANRLLPTIKFTYSFFPDTVKFLKTEVHLITNHIEIEL